MDNKNLMWLLPLGSYHVIFPSCSHKTRLHIGQLVKDTSAKLKQASDIDHHVEVNVSLDLYLVMCFIWIIKEVYMVSDFILIGFWNALTSFKTVYFSTGILAFPFTDLLML